MPYADLIILALIAGFIILRLRSVLGQNVGRPPETKNNTLDLSPDDAVVHMPGRGGLERVDPAKDPDEELLAALTDSGLRENIVALKQKDTTFSLSGFLVGAKSAFEMVFDAFTKADKTTLQMLLSPVLYTEFSQACDDRTKKENRTETTLVAVESAEVSAVQIIHNMVRITVRFISEQVSVTRDNAGAIIDGDPSRTERVQDEWVFEREISSRNPNWKIIDT